MLGFAPRPARRATEFGKLRLGPSSSTVLLQTKHLPVLHRAPLAYPVPGSDLAACPKVCLPLAQVAMTEVEHVERMRWRTSW